jgi:M6 family metalloprotease-like protein
MTRIDGWRRMPRSAQSYDPSLVEGGLSGTFHEHLRDALALFPEVDFSRYDVTLVVAAPTTHWPLSPAFNAYPGAGAQTAHGKVRLAVTFGKDSYANRFTNLVDEVTHLLGLPDLYKSGGDLSLVGGWDVMSDIFHGTSLLGWHRHKLGWLDDSRKTYLTRGSLEVTLTPLSESCGLSMIVIPAGDASAPSKVWVVELAEPVAGTNGTTSGEGVLVYTVDANVPTLRGPVRILPKRGGAADPLYGYLRGAPFQVGDPFADPSGRFVLSVVSKSGRSYKVRIAAR